MRKKNRIVSLLIILAILPIFILQMNLSKEYSANAIHDYEFRINSIQSALIDLPNDNDEKLQIIRENYNHEIKLLEEQIEAVNSGNWEQELRNQIVLDELHIANILNGNVIGGEPLHQVEARINQNNALLELNIKPVNEYFATEGLYFTKNIVSLTMGIIGFLLFIFLIGDVLAVEFEKRTINLLFTQPYSRHSILGIKFITAIIAFILIMLIVMSVSMILGILFGGGVGTLNYPIQVYGLNDLTVISLGNLLLNSFLLFLMFIIFTIILCNFLSIITDNSLLSIGITLIVGITFNFVITQYGLFSNIAHLIPFTYINVFDIINGTLPTTLENENLTFSAGVWVLVFLSGIFYAASTILITKKQLVH